MPESQRQRRYLATVRFLLKQLIGGKQHTHPIDEPCLPGPAELGGREFGGEASSATVARAITDHCDSGLATAFHEQAVLVVASAFNAVCD